MPQPALNAHTRQRLGESGAALNKTTPTLAGEPSGTLAATVSQILPQMDVSSIVHHLPRHANVINNTYQSSAPDVTETTDNINNNTVDLPSEGIYRQVISRRSSQEHCDPECCNDHLQDHAIITRERRGAQGSDYEKSSGDTRQSAVQRMTNVRKLTGERGFGLH